MPNKSGIYKSKEDYNKYFRDYRKKNLKKIRDYRKKYMRRWRKKLKVKEAEILRKFREKNKN